MYLIINLPVCENVFLKYMDTVYVLFEWLYRSWEILEMKRKFNFTMCSRLCLYFELTCGLFEIKVLI